ncbi:MAG TPA: hypothetical protein VER33_01880 [Polyangiaceae bacterium]|nr:hypothetical protein [Polyangiaceae bacterium]
MSNDASQLTTRVLVGDQLVDLPALGANDRVVAVGELSELIVISGPREPARRKRWRGRRPP